MNLQSQKTQDKILIGTFFISILLIILILVIFALTRSKNEDRVLTDLGYGDAEGLIALGDDPLFEEDTFEPDTYFPTDQGIYFYSPEVNVENNFGITYEEQSENNMFRIQSTSVEIPGVVFATWSSDMSHIIFNKTETGCAGPGMCIDDTANLWIIYPDGTGLKKLFDYENKSSISYISNGTKVAFSVLDKVGTVNIDGSGLTFLEEFEALPVPGDSIYVPEVEYLSDEVFTVDFDGELREYRF